MGRRTYIYIQLRAPDTLPPPPEKGLQYPLDWRLCGPQGNNGHCGEETGINPFKHEVYVHIITIQTNECTQFY